MHKGYRSASASSPIKLRYSCVRLFRPGYPILLAIAADSHGITSDLHDQMDQWGFRLAECVHTLLCYRRVESGAIAFQPSLATSLDGEGLSKVFDRSSCDQTWFSPHVVARVVPQVVSYMSSRGALANKSAWSSDQQ